MGAMRFRWNLMSFAVANLAGCEMCSDKYVVATASPEASKIAYVMERDCGATTPVASWVLIADAGEAVDKEADLAVVVDGTQVRVRWESSSLVVVNANGGKAFDKRAMVRGVKIQVEGERE